MVFAYREHQSLRDRQLELESEIAVAANMQQTLLPEVIPYSELLDIGVISVPAHKMSGDYYHYIKDENGCVGVAIADIIGKGVPAALCMSMIKYAMDSTGLGIFIGALKATHIYKGSLVLTGMSERIRSLFTITGLSEVITIEEGETSK